MRLRQLTIVLLGTAAACIWQAAAAQGADLMTSPTPMADQDVALPAVSAINGKWEFDGGYITATGGNVRAAGSVSVPLGDRFGVQGDAALTLATSGVRFSTAMHAFTRDPSKYLAGVTAGVVVAPNATLAALGAEGELYMDRFSLEGWAGIAGINYVDPAIADQVGFFAIGDVAYYPMDDWRLAFGGSDMLGDLSLHAGSEYLFHDLGTPISLTADARLHNTGAFSLMFGVKGYLGGNDNDKSLIDRQRQDDPPNRALDLFATTAGLFAKTAPGAPGTPEDPEQAACEALNTLPHDNNLRAGWNDPESGCHVYDDGDDEGGVDPDGFSWDPFEVG